MIGRDLFYSNQTGQNILSPWGNAQNSNIYKAYMNNLGCTILPYNNNVVVCPAQAMSLGPNVQPGTPLGANVSSALQIVFPDNLTGAFRITITIALSSATGVPTTGLFWDLYTQSNNNNTNIVTYKDTPGQSSSSWNGTGAGGGQSQFFTQWVDVMITTPRNGGVPNSIHLIQPYIAATITTVKGALLEITEMNTGFSTLPNNQGITWIDKNNSIVTLP